RAPPQLLLLDIRPPGRFPLDRRPTQNRVGLEQDVAMRRAWIVLLAAAFGLSGLPAPAGAEGAAPDFVAVNPRGVAHNESSEPTHLVFTVDMFSLPTGERV